MKRPAFEDIQTAADWLDCNEGEDGEAEACSRVATWLRAYAQEAKIKAAARKVGCTPRYFRKMMMK